ncbi:MAG: hypothetical protein QNJ30_09885 [Kiloniellales bacterium]|nr:hypothetical protein [Kiloniellales bacterium]
MAVARLLATFLVVSLILHTTARADEEPDATLTFQSTNVGVGVGVQWGSGVLTLKDGTELPFKVTGGKLVTAGFTKVSGKGEVFGLTNVEDFNGKYGKLGAGGAFVVGKSISVLENEDTKVKIHLSADQEGVEIDLSAGGLGFELRE